MGVDDAQSSKISKGQRTQALILQKALELFSRHGYDQTSFQMIANELKVSQAAPLYHFKSKFGLFEAMVHMILRDLSEYLTEEPAQNATLELRLEALVSAYANWTLIKTSEGQVLSLLYYFAAFENSFAGLYTEFQRQMYAQILSRLPEGSDRELKATLMLDFVLGLGVNLLAGRRQVFAPREIHARIKKMVHMILSS
jgi:AcrR family transcriptional regulator